MQQQQLMQVRGQ